MSLRMKLTVTQAPLLENGSSGGWYVKDRDQVIDHLNTEEQANASKAEFDFVRCHQLPRLKQLAALLAAVAYDQDPASGYYTGSLTEALKDQRLTPREAKDIARDCGINWSPPEEWCAY